MVVSPEGSRFSLAGPEPNPESSIQRKIETPGMSLLLFDFTLKCNSVTLECVMSC